MTTSLAPLPVQRFVDNNGNALTGGKLFTYTAGTSTKQTTYTDSTGATPNTNPIILNSRGECQVWLSQNLAYKFVLSPSTDTDPPTNAFWTVDNIQPGNGAVATGSLMGNSSGSSAAPTPQTIGTNLSLSNGVLSAIPRGHLSGLSLANDLTTPNTVLDILPGYCTDSTNTVGISLPSFTKSVSGTWAAGSGNNGMGVGLSATANTWYHVFAIINGGTYDVYFDTSVSGANAPAGTSALRRIGAFFYNATPVIQPFYQYGDDFWYVSEVLSQNVTGFGNNIPTPFAASTPLGVSTTAIIKIAATCPGNVLGFHVAGPFTTGIAVGAPSLIQAAGISAAGQFRVLTDTLQHVTLESVSASGVNFQMVTQGWTDTRGRTI